MTTRVQAGLRIVGISWGRFGFPRWRSGSCRLGEAEVENGLGKSVSTAEGRGSGKVGDEGCCTWKNTGMDVRNFT